MDGGVRVRIGSVCEWSLHSRPRPSTDTRHQTRCIAHLGRRAVVIELARQVPRRHGSKKAGWLLLKRDGGGGLLPTQKLPAYRDSTGEGRSAPAAAAAASAKLAGRRRFDLCGWKWGASGSVRCVPQQSSTRASRFQISDDRKKPGPRPQQHIRRTHPSNRRSQAPL